MQIILGIETSCDETAAALVADGHRVLGSAVSSQIAKHSCYGGVVPELAAREHLDALAPIVEAAMKEAKVSPLELAAVAVTNGPGLMPALLVGVNFAKGIASSHKLPLIGVNHFLAHIYGTFLDEAPDLLADPGIYPMLALVVSGGHSALVLISSNGEARVVGHTLDDAAGEAFDKAAKLLNLGYPGGPLIEKAAMKGDLKKYAFPRSLTGSTGHGQDDVNRFNFSFSGLKTALLYHCRKLGGPETLEGTPLFDTIASYQEAIVDVLCLKTFSAARHYNAKSLVLCGGVACNTPLRERFANSAPRGLRAFVAPKKYCTDNAVMVAGLAFHQLRQNPDGELASLDAYARLPEISSVPFLLDKSAFLR